MKEYELQTNPKLTENPSDLYAGRWSSITMDRKSEFDWQIDPKKLETHFTRGSRKVESSVFDISAWPKKQPTLEKTAAGRSRQLPPLSRQELQEKRKAKEQEIAEHVEGSELAETIGVEGKVLKEVALKGLEKDIKICEKEKVRSEKDLEENLRKGLSARILSIGEKLKDISDTKRWETNFIRNEYQALQGLIDTYEQRYKEEMPGEIQGVANKLGDLLRDAAGDRFDETFFGEKSEVRSPSDLREIELADLRRGSDVRKAFEEFSRLDADSFGEEGKVTENLYNAYIKWKYLEKKFGAFDPAKHDTYSDEAIAVFKTIDRIEHELSYRGVSDFSNRKEVRRVIAEEKNEAEQARQREKDAVRLRQLREMTEKGSGRQRTETADRERPSDGIDLERGLSDREWERMKAQIRARAAEDVGEGVQLKDISPEEEEKRFKQSSEASGKRLERVVKKANERPDLFLAARSESGEDSDEELEDYKTMLGRMQNRSWEEYGWEDGDKNQFIRLLTDKVYGGNEELAKKAATGLLLQGTTFQEANDMANMYIARGRNDERYIDSYRSSLESAFGNFENMSYDEFRNDPDNIEDLAKQIGFLFPDVFGEKGYFPTLERKVKKDKETGRFKTVERVNTANMTEWLIWRMNVLDDRNPESNVDFLNQVKLAKGQMYDTPIDRLLNDPERFFHGADGTEYESLAYTWEIMAVSWQTTRDFWLHKKKVGGDEQKWTDAIKQMGESNIFTRIIAGQPLLAHITQFPERYTVGKDTDANMGKTINSVFMSYAHIASPEDLKRVLDVTDLNDLFSLDKLRDARDDRFQSAKHIRGGPGRSDGVAKDIYLDLRPDAMLSPKVKVGDIYDASGNIRTDVVDKKTGETGEDKLIKAINYFNAQGKPENFVKIVRDIVGARAAEQHNLGTVAKDDMGRVLGRDTKGRVFSGRLTDDGKTVIGEDGQTGKPHSTAYRRRMAELMGFCLAEFMGPAGMNDRAESGPTGHFSDSRKNMYYRVKMGKMRGGKTGNLWDIGEFPNYWVPMMHAIQTTTVAKEDGIFSAQDVKDWHLARREKRKGDGTVEPGEQKTIFQVQTELLAYSTKKDKEIRALEEKVKNHEVDESVLKETKKQYLEEYQRLSQQLLFETDTMVHYAQNSYARWVNLDKRLRLSERLKLSEYVQYVPYVGTVFDREKASKDLNAFITDVRYAYHTYGKLDYSMMIPTYTEENVGGKMKGKWDWIPLGEYLLGNDVLYRDEFKKNGEIDWKKVNKNSELVFKCVIAGYVGAQIRAERARTMWSTDQRNPWHHIEDYIDILRKIPGDLFVDPKDISKTNVPKFFFDPEDLKQIRKLGKMESWRVLKNQLFIDGLFGKSGKDDEGLVNGLGAAFGKFLSATTSVM